MENFDQIRTLLIDHVGLFDELILCVEKKLDAIAANDVDALNNHMKEEQAYIMRLKGLDQKRERLLAEMGMSGKTFRELIANTTGDENSELTMIFEDLSSKVNELQSATDSAKKYIDIQLHSLESLLNSLPADSQNKKNPGKYPEKKI